MKNVFLLLSLTFLAAGVSHAGDSKEVTGHIKDDKVLKEEIEKCKLEKPVGFDCESLVLNELSKGNTHKK